MWISPKDYKIVGALLAEVREKAGITQQELAMRLRKPQSFVSAYESGQRRVDLLELARIASALGADPRAVCNQILNEIAPSSKRTKG